MKCEIIIVLSSPFGMFPPSSDLSCFKIVFSMAQGESTHFGNRPVLVRNPDTHSYWLYFFGSKLEAAPVSSGSCKDYRR